MVFIPANQFSLFLLCMGEMLNIGIFLVIESQQFSFLIVLFLNMKPVL